MLRKSATPQLNVPATPATMPLSTQVDFSSLIQAEVPPDAFFPRIKLLWAIDAQNNPELGMENVGKLLLVQGEGHVVIPDNAVVTLLASREMSRKLTHEDEGVSYELVYRQMKGAAAGASHEAFLQTLTDPSWDKGIASLVGLLMPDGNVALAEWPCFKSTIKYFYAKFQQAALLAGLGLKLLPCNHMRNLKANKRGTGSYPDPAKFTAHETVTLSRDQQVAVAKAVEANLPAFMAWLEK